MRLMEVEYVGEVVIGSVRYARNPLHDPVILKSKVDSVAPQLKYWETYLSTNVLCSSSIMLLISVPVAC
jgi:hypothetical protein